MRSHHVIAVVAVVLIGFGVKLFFFSAPKAEANIQAFSAVPTASMNVLQMHLDYPNTKDLPVESVKDPM